MQDEPVPGGGDGTWFSRSLFNCPDGHGRFLPVHQLRKIPRLLVWPTPVSSSEGPIPPTRTKNKFTTASSFQSQQKLNSNSNVQLNSFKSINFNTRGQNVEIHNSENLSQYCNVSVSRESNFSNFPISVSDSSSHCSISRLESTQTCSQTVPQKFQGNLSRSKPPSDILSAVNNKEDRPHSATPTTNINRIDQQCQNEPISEEAVESASQYSRYSSGFDEDSLSSKSTSDKQEYLHSTGSLFKGLKKSETYTNFHQREHKVTESSKLSKSSSGAVISSPGLFHSYSSTSIHSPSNSQAETPNPQFVYSLYNPLSNNPFQLKQPIQNNQQTQVPQNPGFINFSSDNSSASSQPANNNNPGATGFAGTYAPVVFGVPQGTAYAPVLFAVPNNTTYTPLLFGLPSSETPQLYAPVQFGTSLASQFATPENSSSVSPSSAGSFPGFPTQQNLTHILHNKTSSSSRRHVEIFVEF